MSNDIEKAKEVISKIPPENFTQMDKVSKLETKSLLISKFMVDGHGADWTRDRIFYNLPHYSNSWDWLRPVYLKIIKLLDPPGKEIRDIWTGTRYQDIKYLQGAILSADITQAFEAVYSLVNKYWKR